MEYRPLGRTGVSVSQMCLGAMMFGAFGNADHDDAVQIIHKALDAGITSSILPTATGGRVGRSSARRWPEGGATTWCWLLSSVLLSTRIPTTAERHGGGSPKGSTVRCAGFEPDWIDLYQVGVPDPNTDVDETLGALSDLVHRRQDPVLRRLQGPRL